MNKVIALILTACISGCSLVQWLPSSSCEEVTYQRIKNKVEVYARCDV
jgi:hypothetical protein